MEPKLIRFFFLCMLPEIVDGRYLRNMKIREPVYILDAIKIKNDEKKNPNKRKSKTTKKQVVVEEGTECDEVGDICENDTSDSNEKEVKSKAFDNETMVSVTSHA